MTEHEALVEKMARYIDDALRDAGVPSNALIWSRPGGPSNMARSTARAALRVAAEAMAGVAEGCQDPDDGEWSEGNNSACAVIARDIRTLGGIHD